MDDITIQSQSPALLKSVLNNLISFFQSFGTAEAIESTEEGGIFRWHTGISHPWFEGILVTRPAQIGDDLLIIETIQYFSNRQALPFTLWFSPEVDQSGWIKLLSQMDFHKTNETPGMARELSNLPVTSGGPPGLSIQEIDNLVDLYTWCTVFIEGYELPDTLLPALFNLLSGIGLHSSFRYYLGWLSRQVTATSLSFISEDVIGIYFVATLPAYRRKGIGAAMTLEPLIVSRSPHIRLGVLQSSRMGFPVYKKLGFIHVGNLENYYWAGS